MNERVPTVPGFEVVRRIGRGGMGDVYQAVRVGPAGFRRPVALKQLAAPRTLDGDAVKRFLREARVAARADHPNIVRVDDLVVEGGTPYIVMELLRGRDLLDLARAAPGQLPVWLALGAALQALAGLDYAHAMRDDAGRPLGLIHRDVTPRNLYLCDSGQLKLLDFGIAKLRDDLYTALTRSSSVHGTLEFLAPEQARGESADPRTDLYQLGGTMYWALTGRYPHGSGTPAELLARVMQGEPTPMAALRPELPPAVGDLVARAMAPRMDDRFPDARAMRSAVELALAGADAGPDALARFLAGLPAEPPPRAPSTDATVDLLGSTELADTPAPTAAPSRTAAAAQATWTRATFRRGTVLGARFLADGASFVYAAGWDGEPSDLFVGLPGSPEARALGIRGATLLGLSRGGELLVLLEPKVSFGYMRRGTLARVPLAGGTPRELLESVQWADWIGDGELAVVRWQGDRATRLEFPLGRVVLETTVGWLGEVRVAPDGARVAFVRHPALYDDSGTVALADRDGQVEVLTDEWNSIQGLAWSPDGREIWFTAAVRGNARALYAVTPGQRARLIARMPAELTLDDIDARGRVLLRREQSETRVAGAFPGDTVERDLTVFDFSYAIDMSRDGTQLLIGEGGSEATGAEYAVYLRRQGDARPVRLHHGIAGSLSPDGKTALVVSKQRDRVTVVPTGVGELRDLELGPLRDIGTAAFFPDGRRIVLSAFAEGQGARVFVTSLDSEVPRPVGPPGLQQMMGNPVSPNGRHLALTDSSTGLAVLVDIETGEVRPLPGAQPGEFVGRWTPSDDELYLAPFQAPPMPLERVDVTTGRRQLWRTIAPADPAGVGMIAPSLAMTPDGRGYAYTYTRVLSWLYLADGLM